MAVRRNYTVAVISLTVLGGIAQVSQAETLTIGTPGGANVDPFGITSPAYNTSYSGEYQQIYNQNLFSGPVYIQQVAFASAAYADSSLEPVTYNLALSYGTTNSSLIIPPTTFTASKGSDFTTVFNGTVTTTPTANANGQVFDLLLNSTTPFLYDPSKGNLLLDLNINSSSEPSLADSNGSYISDLTGDQIGRVYYLLGSTSVASDDSGLYTRFTVQPATATAVPETGTMALAGLGLLPLLVSARRRRR